VRVGYLLRRLSLAVLTLWVATMVTFLLVSLSGDPLSSLALREPPPPQSEIDRLRANLNLDGSIPSRYFDWLTGVIRGDFGRTVQGAAVGDMIVPRLLVTLKLVVFGVAIALVASLVVGVVSACKQYQVFDNVTSITTYVALALPVFWIAVILKSWAIEFNEWIGSRVFHVIGSGDGWSASDLVGYVLLPAVCLSVTFFAAWSRYVRSSMASVLREDYIKLGLAKGMSFPSVVLRHGLKNVLVPFLTVVALDIGGLIGGAVVVETVFQWRGMGDLLVSGVANREVNVVMAWLLVVATVIILVNLVVDLLYVFLDPRIAVGEADGR
jgi:peptide/nickel transport system permease protein